MLFNKFLEKNVFRIQTEIGEIFKKLG